MTAPWQRVRFARLAFLLEAAPPAIRWRWRLVKKPAPHLQVVSPRGVPWDFKLSGGAWVRKTGVTQAEPKPNRGQNQPTKVTQL